MTAPAFAYFSTHAAAAEWIAQNRAALVTTGAYIVRNPGSCYSVHPWPTK